MAIISHKRLSAKAFLLLIFLFLSTVAVPNSDGAGDINVTASPGPVTLDGASQSREGGSFVPLPSSRTGAAAGTVRPGAPEGGRQASQETGVSSSFNTTDQQAKVPAKPGGSAKFAELSDSDKARLAEYLEMAPPERDRVAEYCGMTGVEKDKIDEFSKKTAIELAGSAEYARLSDRERARIAKYSKFSAIDLAGMSRYCRIVDVEKGREAEFAELSDIEKTMAGPRPDEELFKPEPLPTQKLAQFGYNFFKPDGTGFAAQTDVPVGDDYLVGPGDRIVLQLWGSVTGVYELEVNRSGEVYVPRIGAVKVWGVPFGRLPDLLRASLAREFRDFQLNVNMGKLRMIKVYVVGEVKSPGDYNVSSLSTVINALSAAGGPSKNGSLRNILVRRPGRPAESVDLYNFFLKGDKSCDVRLQSGDTIYVPVVKKVAGIGGNVRRPAIFELKNEKTLTDLLVLAAGINPTGYLHRIQVVRVDAHEKKLVNDFNIDPRGSEKDFLKITGAIKLQNLDMVRVFAISSTLRDHVRIEGYVRRPGDYAFRDGMRVKDLFGKDDILPETYKDVVVITRLRPPDYHAEKFSVNLGKALSGEEKHNVALQEFDRVKVFSRWEMEEKPVVRIVGEVQKPGEYRLLENMRLRDLIYDAGNIRKTAYLSDVEITRVKISDTGVTSVPLAVNLKEALKGNPEHNIVLEPFDSVSIRKIPNWVEETSRYVYLSGEVMFPGLYPIYKGERLSSVLTRAGGFTSKAYLPGGKFTRLPVQELQQKRMDDFIFRTERDISYKMQELSATAASKEELEATKASLEGLQASMQKLKTLKAEGRMTIQLSSLDTFKGSAYDIELMGGDTLEVPQSLGAVVVLGEVYNPTTLVQIPGKDLSYYLNQAGGPTGSAEEDEIYVVKADGSIYSRQQSSFGIHWDREGKKWTLGGFYSMQPQPGETIVVPRQMERTAWLRTIKDITTIISQIALSAGTVWLGLK
ncbi:MAG: SLBB domain-containing protein [Geobacteraceae bacterium]|nr:SLBB domain-containing protein [Geobacteraceae bacterium]